MNLIGSKYIEWLIKMSPSVIVFLGGFLSGFLSSYMLLRIKVRGEIRQKHFGDIKLRVLKPLNELISQCHIPILEHNKGNLFVDSIPIIENISALKPPVSGFQYQIAIREPARHEENQSLLDKMHQIPIPSNIDRHLLNDVGTCHYPDLVESFKVIQVEFEKYNERCRLYAEELKEEIILKTGLPERRNDDYSQEKWINANKFAIFVFERQIGISPYYVKNSPGRGGYFELTLDQTTLAQGTEIEMSSAAALIDSLVKQTSKNQELITMAKELGERVAGLREKLEKLVLTHKLYGTCSYCKI